MSEKKYEISSSTFIVIPIKNNLCRVIDADGNHTIKCSALTIIKNACSYFGSSLDARHMMTKKLINVNYKPPIIIEESRSVIFFPTSSHRDWNCIWISLNAVKKYVKRTDKTIITFKNDTFVDIPVSYNIIDNQMARSIMLEKELDKRKKSF